MLTCPECGADMDGVFACAECERQVDRELTALAILTNGGTDEGFKIFQTYFNLPRPKRVVRDGSKINLWYDREQFLSCRHLLFHIEAVNTYFSSEQLYRVSIDMARLIPARERKRRSQP